MQHFYRSDAPDTYSLVEESRLALKEALSLPNVSPLQRAFCHADLAQLHARTGDAEIACEHASQSVSIAHTSTLLRQRLMIVRTFLKPYADVTAVKELHEQMRTFSFVVS